MTFWRHDTISWHSVKFVKLLSYFCHGNCHYYKFCEFQLKVSTNTQVMSFYLHWFELEFEYFLFLPLTMTCLMSRMTSQVSPSKVNMVSLRRGHACNKSQKKIRILSQIVFELLHFFKLWGPFGPHDGTWRLKTNLAFKKSSYIMWFDRHRIILIRCIWHE